MKFDKEIEVLRVGYQPVSVKINLDDKNASFSIDGDIMFIDLCRYLIESTPLLEVEYERKCPYKLNIEKVHYNKTFLHKEFSINFLEVKGNEICEKTSHIINLIEATLE